MHSVYEPHLFDQILSLKSRVWLIYDVISFGGCK